ncbi:MAG TPA: hypothetical protein VMV56_04485 [Williamwhitmania sp.]|nr:hypothetical protein [Williamwhitmania sp.]
MKKYSTLLIMYEHLPINNADSLEPDPRLLAKVDEELINLLGPKLELINPSEELVERILRVAAERH